MAACRAPWHEAMTVRAERDRAVSPMTCTLMAHHEVTGKPFVQPRRWASGWSPLWLP